MQTEVIHPGAAVLVVIDNCVLLRACTPTEHGHAEALAFIRTIRAHALEGRVEVHEPTEFLLEFFAAYHKRGAQRNINAIVFQHGPENVDFAREIHAVSKEAALHLMDVHRKLLPGQPAFTSGADLVYLALALRLDATLVTVDGKLLSYSAIAKVMDPTSFLAELLIG